MLAAAAKDALSLYKENIGSLKIDCDYIETDAVLFGVDDEQSEELDEILHASINAGIGVQYVDKIPVQMPFKKALSFPWQAQIHPAKYVYALARAFEQAGGVILDKCLISKTDGKEVQTIHSGRGELQARNIIYATHIPPGVNVLNLRCAPYRSYVLAVELADGQYPANPCYDMMDPDHYYRTQEIDGRKYLIAGGRRFAGG